VELLQLMYFCDAAELENFSKTAKKHSVPTSGISQAIKRLEGELSVRLFNRTANKVTLSDEGKIFYEGVKNALLSLKRAEERLLESGDGLCGEIRLALRTHRRTVTAAIERFRETYPGVSFVITHGEQVDGFDFIITSNERHYGRYRKELIFKEKLLLAVADDSQYEGDRLSDYYSARFVAMGPGTDFHAAMLEACNNAGFEPNIVIQSDDPYYVRKYVEMGMGVTLVPSISWRGLFSEGVRLLDVGEIYRSVYLYHKDDSEMSRAAGKFLPTLLETFGKEERQDEPSLE